MTIMLNRYVPCGAIALTLGFGLPLGAQQKCDTLADLKLPHTTITSAKELPAGNLRGGAANSSPVAAPARCVVEAVARPTSDSEIQFEVWMPAAGWNGKYQQQGNGGWAGAIPTQAIATALRRGYAAAGTNDGHAANAAGADWAIGHPEKLIDFAYRALHETRENAVAIIAAYYGKPAARNYFSGCSDGGREALMEAQRYPEDFDGILAGAPASDWSDLMTGFVWNQVALLKEAASAIPPEKLPAIQKASLAACDALDGVVDGLVEDPRACHFDPAAMACKGGDTNECLNPGQVEAVRKIYAGPSNSRTRQAIYPGFARGTETAWTSWISTKPPEAAQQFWYGDSYFGQAVFENPKWDFRTLNFDSDLALSAAKAGVVLNANNPDLRTFRAHGGKLIQYHGWGDAAIPAQASIDYYERVRAFLERYPDGRGKGGRPVEEFYRLFLVPGMGHCGGGVGPTNFGNGGPVGGQYAGDAERDIVVALDRWVEQGVAPARLIGTGRSGLDPQKTLTRPLCVYPQVARYKGTGDANDWANFTCAAPK